MILGPSEIKILSINVGRCSATHEIALELAFNTNTDILLIQEPYIHRDLRKVTRNHPSFTCFSPTDTWSVRPRVMSYTKKNNHISCTRSRPRSDRGQGMSDVLFLSFQLQEFSTEFLAISKIWQFDPEN